MSRWERSQQKVQPPAALEDLFTPEQLDHLVSLHACSRALRIAESGLDPSRIQFACWLVEHGKLSENIQAASRDSGSLAPVPAGGSRSDGQMRHTPSIEEVA
jgi:hypothetical protein